MANLHAHASLTGQANSYLQGQVDPAAASGSHATGKSPFAIPIPSNLKKQTYVFNSYGKMVKDDEVRPPPTMFLDHMLNLITDERIPYQERVDLKRLTSQCFHWMTEFPWYCIMDWYNHILSEMTGYNPHAITLNPSTHASLFRERHTHLVGKGVTGIKLDATAPPPEPGKVPRDKTPGGTGKKPCWKLIKPVVTAASLVRSAPSFISARFVEQATVSPSARKRRTAE